MKPLHEELKDIRIEKNITLEEIADFTKIRHSFLEEIEKGNYSILPMPYVRAFLREYGEYVGVDPARVMAVLDKKASTIRETGNAVEAENDTAPTEPPPASGAPVVDAAESAEPAEPKQPSAPDSQANLFGDVESSAAETPPETGDTSPSGDDETDDAGDTDTAETASQSEKSSDDERGDTDAGERRHGGHPPSKPSPGETGQKETEDTEPPADDDDSPAIITGDTHNPLDALQPEPIEKEEEPGSRDTENTVTAEPDITVGTAEPPSNSDVPPPAKQNRQGDEERKPVSIEEPGTSNILFFIFFFILIVIAGAVIFWMNSG